MKMNEYPYAVVADSHFVRDAFAYLRKDHLYRAKEMAFSLVKNKQADKVLVFNRVTMQVMYACHTHTVVGVEVQIDDEE